MKIKKIIIALDGLPTLNEHDNANRANRFGGASMKKKATKHCALYIKNAMNKGFSFDGQPTDLIFKWYLKDRRKDKDNVAFAKKYIFDGMVDAKLIENDGWKQIGDWSEVFLIDKEFERVEIIERKDG